MAAQNRSVRNSAKSQIDQTLRIGVVVQGPLLSTGRTLRDVRKREFVCAPEIERTYEMATQLDAEFILITWANQEKTFLPNIPTNLIHQIEFPKKRFPISFLNNWNNNNKYKQYYSTLMGVLELKKLGVTHVVKVRTDSFLDLRSVKEFLTANSRQIPNAITTPALNVEKPDLFIDYYFAGAIKTVEKFLNIMLYDKELYSNVHFDSFYKYARKVLDLKNLYLIQCLYRGERVRPNRTRQNIIKQTWLRFLTPGPRKLFEDYTWRGEIFGKSYKEDILVFAEDLQQEDFNLTMQTIENVLEESFETMEPGEKIEIRSVPTFFVSSYFEDFLHRMSALEYKLKRKLRENLKSIVLTLRNRKT